ncbi:zeta toxin family protein [Liquorilactobacillus mali]|uniref:zeta toxin family protein n=1 Tax=Liquorilactobacillus mali TaxID=1618 RepID=UPI002654C8D6|nr:zeta toxin family protein [Liquorilactobacillus mali]MDN7145863.1 zeta toxin family protein [Liquorilactobacillus mali]
MSKPVLIVLRGNSGCGKTYLAKKIQNYYGTENSFLIQQDIIRRNILHSDDHVGNRSIKLMAKMLEFGKQNYDITILEGILRKDVYSEMLRRAINEFEGKALFFYLDVSFEQTVKNNSKKKISFRTEQLRSWWREKDYFSKHDIIMKENCNDNNDQIILKKVAELMI